MKELKIVNSTPVQEDFWGNGAVYHGYAGMPDNSGRIYSDELCVLEAERAAKMKLKIARTFYKWWAWDEKTNTWDWNNNIMTAFYKWLKRMKDANITVALNAGWCCPGDIDSSSWNGKSPFTVQGDWEKSVQNYADWVSETVRQLIEIRGFTNIKILVMFTEPNHGFGNLNFYNCWADAVKAAHETLVHNNQRHLVKLMGSNEGSGITSEMLKWVSENDEIKDVIDIYSSHTYERLAIIGNKHIKTGKTAISMLLAGARFRQTVKLKPNTDYVVSIDVLFHPSSVDPANIASLNGNIHFGVFVDNGRNDIHATGGGPEKPVANGSTYSIRADELGEEYKRFTLHFNSGDAESGVVGAFHDILTQGISYVDNITLCEAVSGVSVVPNSDFSDYYNGWDCTIMNGKRVMAGGINDAYYDWYKWTKLGIGYSNNHPFCYDEYDSIYDRDHSRDSHGAEIVTAAIAMMNAGAQSSLLWTLFDQQWPNNHATTHDAFVDGDQRAGLMPVLTRSLIPHKSYYAFALISRYIEGEGTKVYEGFGENNLHTTMSVSPDGDITLVVVNCKDEDDEFMISFEKTLGDVSLNRHLFNPATCLPDEKAEIIMADKIFKNISTSLADEIPAFGVAVYTTMND